jgi:hypothetical protein
MYRLTACMWVVLSLAAVVVVSGAPYQQLFSSRYVFAGSSSAAAPASSTDAESEGASPWPELPVRDVTQALVVPTLAGPFRSFTFPFPSFPLSSSLPFVYISAVSCICLVFDLFACCMLYHSLQAMRFGWCRAVPAFGVSRPVRPPAAVARSHRSPFRRCRLRCLAPARGWRRCSRLSPLLLPLPLPRPRLWTRAM